VTGITVYVNPRERSPARILTNSHDFRHALRSIAAKEIQGIALICAPSGLLDSNRTFHMRSSRAQFCRFPRFGRFEIQ
jgi:hypothetical protein